MSQQRVQKFYDEKSGSNPSLNEANKYFTEEYWEASEEIEGLDSIIGNLCDIGCIECDHDIECQMEVLAKELADVLFTLYGVAIAAGIDLDKAFDIVCESNMTKPKAKNGKVSKGKNYREPDMKAALL